MKYSQNLGYSITAFISHFVFRVLHIFDSGLGDYLYKRNNPEFSAMNICKKLEPIKGETKLKLHSLSSAFHILAFGSGLATIAFILEIAYQFLQRYKIWNQN